jgi:hypothetical protein
MSPLPSRFGNVQALEGDPSLGKPTHFGTRDGKS